MDNNWYAIYTSSRCEKSVFAELKKRTIECCLPLQAYESQWSDRRKKIEVPIVENYVFVKCLPSDFLQILSIRGVVMFITDRRNNPLILDEKVIKDIHSLPDIHKLFC